MNEVVNVYSFKEIEINSNDKVVIIDGKDCKTLESYFKYIYESFGFPNDEEYTLDKYYSLMTDEKYISSYSIKIVIKDYDSFLKKDQKNKKNIYRLFVDKILPYWESETKDQKAFKLFLIHSLPFTISEEEFNDKVLNDEAIKFKKYLDIIGYFICIVILMIEPGFGLMYSMTIWFETSNTYDIVVLSLLGVNTILFLILGILWLILKRKFRKAIQKNEVNKNDIGQV